MQELRALTNFELDARIKHLEYELEDQKAKNAFFSVSILIALTIAFIDALKGWAG